MNDISHDRAGASWIPGHRSVRGRRGVGSTAVAAVAVLTLLVTACGGPGTAVKSATYRQALAYAHCMRSHGVPGWPGPNSQGMVSASQIQQVPDTPQLQPAEAACAHLQPSGHYVQVSSAQMHKLTTEGLRFSNCMRTHGIPDFPDPDSAHLQTGASDGTWPASIAARRNFSPRRTPAKRYCPGGGSRDRERHQFPEAELAAFRSAIPADEALISKEGGGS